MVYHVELCNLYERYTRMNDKSNNIDKSIYDLVSIIKLMTLAFISLIIITPIIEKNSNPFESFNKMTYIFILIVILAFAIIYLLWAYLYLKIWESPHRIIYQTIENYLFIAILTILIISSNSNTSEYKYLFIFTIISTTLGLNKRQGLIIATVSSFIVLSIDLIYTPKMAVNVYFENDLIIVSLFLIIALVLGQYAQIEKDRRRLLELEMKEQLEEHKHIETQLLKNDSLSNLLIDNFSDAILIHNGNKGIMYANKNALKLLGVTAKEIAGKLIFEYEDKNDTDSINSAYIDILKKRELEISFEEIMIDSKGVKSNVRNTSTYYLYQNEAAILTIFRDVKPIIQLQKLRRDAVENLELLNQSIEYGKLATDFFSNISHELKTPLCVLFSSLQLLNLYNDNFDPEITKKKKEYLAVMKQNCNRLLRLINNLLDINKYDAGFIIPHMQKGDIVGVLEGITTSIVPYAEIRKVTTIFDTNVEEKVIAFDTEKIERVFLNLFSNCLKFTNEGGFIYVNVAAVDENAEIIISVRDTGIGIPEDKKNHIFERFGQVDKSFKRNSEGTGIGLSIVKSFIELHGGKIELKSELGIGSEFIITLPTGIIESNIFTDNEIEDDISEKVDRELADL